MHILLQSHILHLFQRLLASKFFYLLLFFILDIYTSAIVCMNFYNYNYIIQHKYHSFEKSSFFIYFLLLQTLPCLPSGPIILQDRVSGPQHGPEKPVHAIPQPVQPVRVQLHGRRQLRRRRRIADGDRRHIHRRHLVGEASNGSRGGDNPRPERVRRLGPREIAGGRGGGGERIPAGSSENGDRSAGDGCGDEPDGVERAVEELVGGGGLAPGRRDRQVPNFSRRFRYSRPAVSGGGGLVECVDGAGGVGGE